MSRVAKKPVELAKGVSAEVQGQTVTIKGAKGSLALNVNTEVEVKVDGVPVNVAPRSGSTVRECHGRHDARADREYGHGSHDGLPAQARARRRRLPRGRAGPEAESHARLLASGRVPDPEGHHDRDAEPDARSSSRAWTGSRSAKSRPIMRGYRPPEPYKGKGVRYSGEHIVLERGEEEVVMATDKKAQRQRRARRGRIESSSPAGPPVRAPHAAAHLRADHRARGQSRARRARRRSRKRSARR